MKLHLYCFCNDRFRHVSKPSFSFTVIGIKNNKKYARFRFLLKIFDRTLHVNVHFLFPQRQDCYLNHFPITIALLNHKRKLIPTTGKLVLFARKKNCAFPPRVIRAFNLIIRLPCEREHFSPHMLSALLPPALVIEIPQLGIT